MLTVRVGETPDQQDFLVHESLLKSRAEYFSRAMNGNWLETDTRVIELPEDEPEVFALYLNHIYTGKLHTMTLNRDNIDALPREEFKHVVGAEYDSIFGVYVLAERLNDPITRDAAITAVFDLAEQQTSDGDWRLPPPSSIRLVYDRTPEKSAARRLLADMVRMK